jgi:pyruvate carboxylase subunit B
MEVTVEREGEAGLTTIMVGGNGRARVGDRPVRYRWEPGAPARLWLDGVPHSLHVRTEAEERLAAIELARPASRAAEIRAPMPGLVLVVEVEEGAEVAEGAGIAIIEAMKMENEITAPVAGVVRAVSVAAGQAVERGALLCRIEPAS